jgi:type IV pilus assembly protein PilB
MDHKISNKTIDKLKYDLVREGLLDYNQLIDSIDHAREQKISLCQLLIQNNIISEEKLLNFIEQKLHIPYVNLDSYTIDINSINLITKEEALNYKIIPLFIIEDTLTIAMADPLDLFTLNNLNISNVYKVEPVICSERSILQAIDVMYNQIEKTIDTENKTTSINQDKITTFLWQKELSDEKLDEVNIYNVIKAIIFQATNENTSDIHLDIQKNELKIRFRIDGSLYDKGSIPILLSQSLISRIKTASGLDPNEQYIPQNGKMELNINKTMINARVSTYPNNYGEKIIIKLFNKAPSLENLGFEHDQLEIFKKALTRKNGLILFTAPPGNGQTTTFYSALEHISSNDKNIMTIESSIRYNIDNLCQSQINTSRYFDKETALQTISLQEPDIIYVDEITNAQELNLIIKYSLMDRLILSSILASSAIGIICKIIEMGIKPELLLECINIVASQKLVRVLCPECKTETTLKPDIIEKYQLSNNNKYFKSNGCNSCNHTGYKGRTALFEVLFIDRKIKNMLNQNTTEDEITKELKKNGYKTILDHAKIKLLKGIISIDEIINLIKV